MAVRQITIFGGWGFIGRYLVRKLAAEGAVIRAAGREPASGSILKPLGNVGQIVLLRASVRDPAAVAAAVAGADAVINLVGILYERGRARFDAVHRAGAENVARAASAAGVRRLVHVSAIGADRRSESHYARSKAAGEAAVRAAFPDVTIVRPSLVIGPEDDFFNRFAALARVLPALPLIGGGRTRFQPVYVGDMADAIANILDRPETAGKTYEIGGPRTYSFKELMELLLRDIGRRNPLVPVPFWAAEFLARFTQLLPVPPLTRDQVRLLKTDNVVTPGALSLRDLDIVANAIEGIIPSYLERFRRGGRFAKA